MRGMTHIDGTAHIWGPGAPALFAQHFPELGAGNTPPEARGRAFQRCYTDNINSYVFQSVQPLSPAFTPPALPRHP